MLVNGQKRHFNVSDVLLGSIMVRCDTCNQQVMRGIKQNKLKLNKTALSTPSTLTKRFLVHLTQTGTIEPLTLTCDELPTERPKLLRVSAVTEANLCLLHRQ